MRDNTWGYDKLDSLSLSLIEDQGNRQFRDCNSTMLLINHHCETPTATSIVYLQYSLMSLVSKMMDGISSMLHKRKPNVYFWCYINFLRVFFILLKIKCIYDTRYASTKVPDTDRAIVASVGPSGPTPSKRIMRCRSARTDAVSNALTFEREHKSIFRYQRVDITMSLE